MTTREISVGTTVRLKSNGFPGAGGLNSVMLIEERYCHGDGVPVIEIVTKDTGKVRMPTGYELQITLMDVE